MKKPDPVKNGECVHCHRDVRLTMPIGYIPGWPIVVWIQLCTECRCAVQCSRHWDRYGVPAYHMEHSPDEKRRLVYRQWLANESL